MPDYSSLIMHIAKTAIAACVGGAVSYLILQNFGMYSDYAGVFTTIYQLAVGVGAGLGVFGGLGLVMGLFRRGRI